MKPLINNEDASDEQGGTQRAEDSRFHGENKARGEVFGQQLIMDASSVEETGEIINENLQTRVTFACDVILPSLSWTFLHEWPLVECDH